MPGIVIGDVHASVKYMEIIQNSFDFLFSTEYYKKSDFIIFQGDLFDHRKNIDVMVLDSVAKIFQKMSNKQIRIIMGNHDMYNKESKDLSSLNVLEKMFKNIEIIKKPTLEILNGINVYMLPFGSRPDEKKIERSDYIFGHLEIYPYFPDSDIKENMFRGKKIFMGHQHKFDPENTPYSGSLFTTGYAETDNQKHFLYIENKDNYSFFKNEKDILHLTMKYDDKENKIIIPFLNSEISLEELNKKNFNEKYKYLLKGGEKEIEKVFTIFAEKEINAKIKTVVTDEETESKEVETINESEIKTILEKKNSVFEIFKDTIRKDEIKENIFKEALRLEN